MTATAHATTTPPPGWYTDPAHQHQMRYWDGATWTDQFADGVPAGDTPPPPPPAAASPPVAAPPQVAAPPPTAVGAPAAPPPPPPAPSSAGPPPPPPPPRAPAVTLAPVVGPAPAPGSTGTPPVAIPINAVECTELAVRVPPDEARAAAVAELRRLGFRTSFTDPWHGVAERGSKGKNLAFGAMAQYFRIDVHVLIGPNGETVIRLLRAKTGYFTRGGLVGKSRTATTFRQVVYDLEQGFQQRGLLLGVRTT